MRRLLAATAALALCLGATVAHAQLYKPYPSYQPPTSYQTYPTIGGNSMTFGSDGSSYQTYRGIGGSSTTYGPGGHSCQSYSTIAGTMTNCN